MVTIKSNFRRIIIRISLLLAVVCCAVPAQERGNPPQIAVCVMGDVSDNERKALGARLLATILNSGKYIGIAQSGSFGAEIDKERQRLRGVAMDDAKIGELGRRFGADFVCVADITPAFGAFQLSARIINSETSRIERISAAESQLKTIDDLAKVSEQLVGSMLGAKALSKAPPAAKAAPAPAAAPVPVSTRTSPPPPPPPPPVAQVPERSVVDVMAEGRERLNADPYQEASGESESEPESAARPKGPFKVAVYVVGGAAGKILTPLICKALEKSGVYSGIENIDGYANGATDDAQIRDAAKQAGVSFVFVIEISPISVRIVDALFEGLPTKTSIDGNVSALNASSVAKKIVNFILTSGPKPEPLDASDQSAAGAAEYGGGGFGAETSSDGGGSKFARLFSLGGGFFIANDVNGIYWVRSNGQLTMSSLVGGLYIFFDATYAEAHLSYSAGGGYWESSNATVFGMPYMSLSLVHLGLLVRYPIFRASERLSIFPMAGGELEFAVSGKLTWEADGSEYLFDGQAGRLDVSYLSSPLLLKIGAGADFDVDIGNLDTYIRAELLYCVRRARPIEGVNRNDGEIDPRGHGLTLRVGMGLRL